MKKFLLSMAALAFAGSAFAADVVLTETDFSKVTEYQFWKSDATNAEVKDGALVITNEAAADNFWDVQYIVADGFALTGGTTYTVNVKIKDFAGTLHYNMGTWSSNDAGGVEVAESADWQNVIFEVTAKADTEASAHLLLQSGEFVGTYEVASVKITYEETGDEPVTPPSGDNENVIATYFDGNGKTFGGWGGSFEQVEEDGKPCLKYSSEEALDFWAAQMAIDLDYAIGETYYFSLEVKGTGEEAITSGYQYAGLNNAGDQVYWGCGNLTNFNATPDWKTVVISGKVEAAEEGQAPGRWVANLGKYVGELYVTNVKVYTLSSSAVEGIAPVETGRTVVYNLLGVKVLDTDDASQLNTLKKGIYIVNGKKVAL